MHRPGNAIKGLGSSDSFEVEQFSERFLLYFPPLVLMAKRAREGVGVRDRALLRGF